MIRINLLPHRYRKISKISKPGLIFSAVVPIVFGLLLTYFLVQHFMYLVPLDMEQQRLAEEEKGYQAQAEAVRRLRVEIKSFLKRKNAIKMIRETRMIWSRKIYQFCNIIPPYVWIEKMAFRSLPVPKKKNAIGGIFEVKCLALGSEGEKVAHFLSTIENDTVFFRDFEELKRPAINHKQNDEMPGGHAMEFTLVLQQVPLEMKELKEDAP